MILFNSQDFLSIEDTRQLRVIDKYDKYILKSLKLGGKKDINTALLICSIFSTAINLKCQSDMNYWESSKKDRPHKILNVLGLKLKYCFQFKYSHM